MSRIGLRRSGIDAEIGDPLDGLVNLFDIGIVLAVAFLIAGLSTSVASKSDTAPKRDPSQERTLTTPSQSDRARGNGTPVGTVYQLPDGRMVLVDPKKGGAPGAAPTAPTTP